MYKKKDEFFNFCIVKDNSELYFDVKIGDTISAFSDLDLENIAHCNLMAYNKNAINNPWRFFLILYTEFSLIHPCIATQLNGCEHRYNKSLFDLERLEYLSETLSDNYKHQLNNFNKSPEEIINNTNNYLSNLSFEDVSFLKFTAKILAPFYCGALTFLSIKKGDEKFSSFCLSIMAAVFFDYREYSEYIKPFIIQIKTNNIYNNEFGKIFYAQKIYSQIFSNILNTNKDSLTKQKLFFEFEAILLTCYYNKTNAVSSKNIFNFSIIDKIKIELENDKLKTVSKEEKVFSMFNSLKTLSKEIDVDINPEKFEIVDDIIMSVLSEVNILIEKKYKLYKCANCGKYYFLRTNTSQKSRLNSSYCFRIDKNGMACKNKGRNMAYALKISNDPLLSLHYKFVGKISIKLNRLNKSNSLICSALDNLYGNKETIGNFFDKFEFKSIKSLFCTAWHTQLKFMSLVLKELCENKVIEINLYESFIKQRGYFNTIECYSEILRNIDDKKVEKIKKIVLSKRGGCTSDPFTIKEENIAKQFLIKFDESLLLYNKP